MKNRPSIEVHGLAKRFRGGRGVAGINLRMEPGEIFGFLGANGSGKTTALRLLCGLLSADAGQGFCLGFDLRKQPAEIKRRVGYLAQRFSLYEDLSVRENLLFMARLHNVAKPRDAVATALREFALEPEQAVAARHLSGGRKQQLALAACLLHRPRILLLDEPTVALDPAAREHLWRKLHELAAQGLSILVSTHYMDEAERCSRLAFFSAGRIRLQGTAAQLIAGSGVAAWTLETSDPTALAARLGALPGAERIAPFGNRLYVSGRNRALLGHSLDAYSADPAIRCRETTPRLDDVFVGLPQACEGVGP